MVFVNYCYMDNLTVGHQIVDPYIKRKVKQGMLTDDIIRHVNMNPFSISRLMEFAIVNKHENLASKLYELHKHAFLDKEPLFKYPSDLHTTLLKFDNLQMNHNLERAIEFNLINLVQCMLKQHGWFELDIFDKYQRHKLFSLAIKTQNLPLIKQLHRKGITSYDTQSLMDLVIERNHLDILKYFVELYGWTSFRSTWFNSIEIDEYAYLNSNHPPRLFHDNKLNTRIDLDVFKSCLNRCVSYPELVDNDFMNLLFYRQHDNKELLKYIFVEKQFYKYKYCSDLWFIGNLVYRDCISHSRDRNFIKKIFLEYATETRERMSFLSEEKILAILIDNLYNHARVYSLEDICFYMDFEEFPTDDNILRRLYENNSYSLNLILQLSKIDNFKNFPDKYGYYMVHRLVKDAPEVFHLIFLQRKTPLRGSNVRYILELQDLSQEFLQMYLPTVTFDEIKNYTDYDVVHINSTYLLHLFKVCIDRVVPKDFFFRKHFDISLECVRYFMENFELPSEFYTEQRMLIFVISCKKMCKERIQILRYLKDNYHMELTRDIKKSIIRYNGGLLDVIEWFYHNFPSSFMQEDARNMMINHFFQICHSRQMFAYFKWIIEHNEWIYQDEESNIFKYAVSVNAFHVVNYFDKKGLMPRTEEMIDIAFEYCNYAMARYLSTKWKIPYKKDKVLDKLIIDTGYDKFPDMKSLEYFLNQGCTCTKEGLKHAVICNHTGLHEKLVNTPGCILYEE